MDLLLQQTVNATALGGTSAQLAQALAPLPMRPKGPITATEEVLR